MDKSLSISNFNRLRRPLVRLILFLVFMEAIITTENWVLLSAQEVLNKKYTVGSNYRILCVGDSVTFVGGIYSYPSQLQFILNQLQPNLKFQVINTGAFGWTTSDMLQHMNGFLNKYRPKMIIVMGGLNDSVFYDIFRYNKNLRTELFLKNIKTYRLMESLWEEISQTILASPSHMKQEADLSMMGQLDDNPLNDNLESFDTTKESPSLNKSYPPAQYRSIFPYHPLTIQNLNAIVEMGLKTGAKVVIMQYPMLDLAPLKTIIQLRNKVDFVDNQEVFVRAVNRHGLKKYFLDQFGHMTKEGNTILSRNVTINILRPINEAIDFKETSGFTFSYDTRPKQTNYIKTGN